MLHETPLWLKLHDFPNPSLPNRVKAHRCLLTVPTSTELNLRVSQQASVGLLILLLH